MVATDEADPALQAEHTRVDHLPTGLDFAFRRTVIDTVAGAAAPSASACHASSWSRLCAHTSWTWRAESPS